VISIKRKELIDWSWQKFSGLFKEVKELKSLSVLAQSPETTATKNKHKFTVAFCKQLFRQFF
jgi:hypothetical protein